MSKRLLVNRYRRRSWRRGRAGNWSKVTLWWLRLVFGVFFSTEPVLVALERWSAGDRFGVMRVRLPHNGIDILISGRANRWRRITRIARTPLALRESAARWENTQRDAGFRTWLTDVEAVTSTDPRKLDTVLCRALVLEVLGRRGRRRGR